MMCPKKTNKNYIEDCVDYVVKKINKFAGKNIFLSPCLGGASGGNFNPIETTLMREIKDALDSFSDAFGHLFDYGCCFFPDMIDAYFCQISFPNCMFGGR